MAVEEKKLSDEDRLDLVRALNDYEDSHSVQHSQESDWITSKGVLMNDGEALGRLERLIERSSRRNFKNLIELGRIKGIWRWSNGR